MESSNETAKVIRRQTAFYPQAWFKVEYTYRDDERIYFKAWTIEGMNEENIEDSDIDEHEVLEGYIKYDGCMEFSYSAHYCSLENAEQFYLLMKEIYSYHENFQWQDWDTDLD